jgi:hypothetical protein
VAVRPVLLLDVDEVDQDVLRPQQVLTRDRPATQIARIRFDPNTSPPPLNSTVDVRLHYTEFSARIAGMLIRFFGLYAFDKLSHGWSPAFTFSRKNVSAAERFGPSRAEFLS